MRARGGLFRRSHLRCQQPTWRGPQAASRETPSRLLAPWCYRRRLSLARHACIRRSRSETGGSTRAPTRLLAEHMRRVPLTRPPAPFPRIRGASAREGRLRRREEAGERGGRKEPHRLQSSWPRLSSKPRTTRMTFPRWQLQASRRAPIPPEGVRLGARESLYLKGLSRRQPSPGQGAMQAACGRRLQVVQALKSKGSRKPRRRLRRTLDGRGGGRKLWRRNRT